MRVAFGSLLFWCWCAMGAIRVSRKGPRDRCWEELEEAERGHGNWSSLSEWNAQLLREHNATVIFNCIFTPVEFECSWLLVLPAATQPANNAGSYWIPAQLAYINDPRCTGKSKYSATYYESAPKISYETRQCNLTDPSWSWCRQVLGNWEPHFRSLGESATFHWWIFTYQVLSREKYFQVAMYFRVDLMETSSLGNTQTGNVPTLPGNLSELVRLRQLWPDIYAAELMNFERGSCGRFEIFRSFDLRYSADQGQLVIEFMYCFHKRTVQVH